MITLQIESNILTAEELSKLYSALLPVKDVSVSGKTLLLAIEGLSEIRKAGIANCGEAEWNRLVTAEVAR